ncbi:hypothetical protein OSTOST_05555, partial [Ostertagia ostertagi]
MRGGSLDGVLVVAGLLISSVRANLRCYRGTETNFTIVKVAPGRMCSYRVGAACEFTKEGQLLVHETADKYLKSDICWYGDQSHDILCPCNTDLCNGNFSSLADTWMHTTISDGSYHHCTLNYLRSKRNLSPADAKYHPSSQGGNQTNAKQTKDSGGDQSSSKPLHWDENPMDWIIFLILCIVAIVLIIILIPVLIYCLVLAGKRSKRKKGSKSSKSSKSSGSKKSGKGKNKSKKGKKSAKGKRSKTSTSSGKSKSSRTSKSNKSGTTTSKSDISTTTSGPTKSSTTKGGGTTTTDSR